ncbi:hypothetical protein M9435_006047 [Picochlorum sp. BPE23]|nr:hypothetical protein M9435_006047 [Picochlorum sp. BPE23]
MLLLFLVALGHLALAPFTKVEESFNVQAVHDVLYFGSQIENYDHIEFPGVVPRTFLGSLCVSFLVKPFQLIIDMNGLPKLYVLACARVTLAALICLAFWVFLKHAAQGYPRRVSWAFIFVCMSQFHLTFYMSRLLPNTLAMGLTAIGLGYWADPSSSPWKSIATLTCTAMIFRCDQILLVGLVGIHMLMTGRVGLVRGVSIGIISIMLSLVCTVCVDSIFWRRWLWPEGEVLWFNTALNKSKDWGVSPWHWYFTSALPRMLHISYPLSFLGALLDSRSRSMMVIACGFVLLYSFLAHKEVRFLFPSLPLWNFSAAMGLYKLFYVSKSTRAIRVIRASVLGGIFLGLLLHGVSSVASYNNYPGGDAMITLQRHVEDRRSPDTVSLSVHIDTLAATTGVSRFLQEPKIGGIQVEYSKQEGLSLDAYRHHSFDYLLNEHPDIPGYTLIDTIQAFHAVQLCGGAGIRGAIQCMLALKAPLEFISKDTLYIHQLNR